MVNAGTPLPEHYPSVQHLVMSTQETTLTEDIVRRAPKVLLHDHLDGGLRPRTIIELADEYGYKGLPSTDADELGMIIRQGADRKDLPKYLEGFAHTCGVMQHRDAIIRTAHECALDLAADGVVYAEVRFAPELHLEAGLTLDEVVEAVQEGFASGQAAAAKAGAPIVIGTLCSAMRQAAQSHQIAALAIRHRDSGVVGFDIAGPENGFPPSRHLDAFNQVHEANFHTTIHAGEAFGLPSIHEALQYCGAERLGHGVRIVDDIKVHEDGSYELGRLAAFVRDRRVPLEMCPSSNVHTGAANSIAEHPIALLKRLRFRVTVNTDNRLMSGVSMTSEMQELVNTFGYGLDDLQWFTVNAMKSAFWPFEDRLRLIDQVIKPTYARFRAELLSA
jgi:adenosine deaminase